MSRWVSLFPIIFLLVAAQVSGADPGRQIPLNASPESGSGLIDARSGTGSGNGSPESAIIAAGNYSTTGSGTWSGNVSPDTGITGGEGGMVPRDDSGSDGTSLSSAVPGPEAGTGTDGGRELATIREKLGEKKEELDAHLLDRGTGVPEQAARDNDLRLAACSMELAADATAAGTTTWVEIKRIAGEINRVADDSLRQEERLRQRNPVVRFLLGGDREAAGALGEDAAGYAAVVSRMEEIQYALNFNQELRPLFSEQAEVIRRENNRISGIATREMAEGGILGFLFR